jgi:glucuronosyltransferase
MHDSYVLFRYRERVSHVSKVMRMRPRPPAKEAADLVEYVQAVGNLDHLKPRGLDLPFYKLYMLDVLLVLGLVIVLVLYLIAALVKAVFRFCCGSSKKIKKL